MISDSSVCWPALASSFAILSKKFYHLGNTCPPTYFLPLHHVPYDDKASLLSPPHYVPV